MLHDNDNALRGQKHLLELDDVWVTEQRVVDDLPLHVPGLVVGVFMERCQQKVWVTISSRSMWGMTVIAYAELWFVLSIMLN